MQARCIMCFSKIRSTVSAWNIIRSHAVYQYQSDAIYNMKKCYIEYNEVHRLDDDDDDDASAATHIHTHIHTHTRVLGLKSIVCPYKRVRV